MKLIQSLIIICLLGAQTNVYASNDNYDWMESSMEGLSSLGCIQVPEFINMHQSSTTLQLEDSGEWVATGIRVEKDKLLQFEWSNKGILPSPDKYKVLYRIDPRFAKPQVFIQKRVFVRNGDKIEEKYVSDFHQFKDGQLLRYQSVPEMTFLNRIQDFTNYFNFIGRSKIPVKKNDVVNIKINQSGGYFGAGSEMNLELGSGDNLLSIYTQSPIPDNRIIYSNATQWCADAITSSRPEFALNCSVFPGKYWDVGSNTKTLQGNISNNAFDSNKLSIDACVDGANGPDNNPVCYYDKGRGMTISVGGTTIKPIAEKFVHSPFTGKDFFYYKSDIEGELDFTTDWSIAGMYIDSGLLNQFMVNWGSALGAGNAAAFNTITAALKANFIMNFVHFGRYLLDVEIGNSSEVLAKSDLDKIKVEYKIVSDLDTIGSIVSNTNSTTLSPSDALDLSAPDSSTSGTSIDQNFRGDAPESGYLWLRVTRPNDNMTGSIQVKMANYTGSTWFSDTVYTGLVKPLREKFNELSQIIYIKLVNNATLQNIARSMMALYIIIYGLMFLAGAVQITVTDIVVRVLKIVVILALFSRTSWTFFSQNLFNVFIDGTDYLLTTVVGVTSNSDNIFGFIDPIIDKYTNGTIWGLLFIQLLQIHTGLTFFAIMTIYSILTYFRAILEVIVSYCLAFLGLAIMISIAPLFIVLMLFERTKSIFDNWLSVMFSYMVQPTILLIFFLFIDQIISDQLLQAVVESCWGTLIPIKISLDLNHIGIPLSFSFSIPGFPGVPFYIPQLGVIESIGDFYNKPGTFARVATASLLFYALCKLMEGLVNYVTLVVEYLTNVLAARQDGKLQTGSNPINDVTDDLGKISKPVTRALGSVKDFGKEKFIDQKITHRPDASTQGEIDYSQIRSRNEDPESGKDTEAGKDHEPKSPPKKPKNNEK